MSANPLFSILVPTYNHAKFIGAALDSVIAQTDPDWEAVVVNDGSTDNTADVLNRYAKRDRRIRVVHKPNGGTGSALNRALAEARGDWICWLSSDDFFDPKKLAIHREWMRREPACRFFFTYFRLFNQAKGTTVDHPLWGPLPEKEFQVLGLFYRNFISGISICIQRQAWQAVGQFNERLRYAQDYDMWLRLLARNPATFVPEWTCISRQHAGQGSELFQQACYYDTAAAGAQFLNDHPFEDLFPLLDLRDSASALIAVERTLQQAADDNAFLYWYGAHPNLIGRTLEWAWNRTLGAEVYQQRAAARKLARQILADTARQLRGTPLGWHWQVASAAAALPNPDFTYQPMSPLDIGLGFLHDLRATGKAEVTELQRYFKMQYNRELPAAPTKLSRRTVVIGDRRPTAAMPTSAVDVARQLHAAGCKVAIIAQGIDRLGHLDGIPLIETQSPQSADAVLNALLPADELVWLQPPVDAAFYPAKRHHVLSDPLPATSATVEQILKDTPNVISRPRGRQERVASKRRKVVFISSSPWAGGAERVTYDLLHRLDRSRYELHFVHLAHSIGHQISFAPAITVHDLQRELAEQPGLRAPIWKRVLRRGFRMLGHLGAPFAIHQESTEFTQHLDPFVASMRQVWPHVVALSRILQRIGSDALLIPVMEDATIRVWLAQAFARQPYCVSLHSAESYNLPPMYPDPARLTIEKFLFSNACRSAAAVTFPCLGCKQDLERNFEIPGERIEVMPNPINFEAVIKSCGDAPEIPLPTLRGRSLFVHAARLSSEKNHQLLLEACSILKQRSPHFLVVCLGDGPQRDEIKQQIAARGLQEHVHLLGAVVNPFAYMARAQGLLLTSRFEGFALVLVEALACGAVPISVDCPFGPRDVLDSGKYGLLVRQDDPAAFAAAMQRVAEDRALREQIRACGAERARHFDLPRVAAQWEALIDRIPATGAEALPSIAKAA